jgi:acetate kinase
MYLLSINFGSSSIKVDIFNYKNLKLINSVNLSKQKNHEKSFETAIKLLNIKDNKQIKAVAHRVVHGGDKYKEATLITPKIEIEIEKLSELAPLHNPINLLGIKQAKKMFKCPHFAIFDTAFHQTIPSKAYTYAIPRKYIEQSKIRKYGFHGTNHKFAYSESCKLLNKKSASGIICHLGSGCSISAIKDGKVIDTSMGFTPLEGLVMGTRSGNVDPSIIFHLQRKYPKLNVEKLLLEKSGLLGLAENQGHMRKIFVAAKNGYKEAQNAIKVFCYRASQYVGFYALLLPQVDFITFTGGIGENANYIRRQILKNLPSLSLPNIFVIKANEALQMAKEVKEKLAKN